MKSVSDQLTVKVPASSTEQTVSVALTGTIDAIATISGTTPIPTTNTPPVVNAGSDLTITLPSNNVVFNPVYSDVDGTVASVQLTKVSGGTANITGLNVTGLVAGSYVFRLTVTDDDGAVATDDVTITVLPAPVTPPSSSPIPDWTPFIQSSFETAPVTTGFNAYIQQPVANCVSISSDVASVGTKSAKFFLSKAQADAGSNWRAEMTLIGKETVTEGYENWYYADYFFPTSYVSANEEFITQWHHDSGTGSPPCALMTQNDKFVWDYITSNGGNDKYITLVTIPKNRWVPILFHFKWSSTNKGLSELWIDGVKVLSLVGPNLFAGITNYMKLGIYKWVYKNSGNGTTSRTIYVDNFKVWKL